MLRGSALPQWGQTQMPMRRSVAALGARRRGWRRGTQLDGAVRDGPLRAPTALESTLPERLRPLAPHQKKNPRRQLDETSGALAHSTHAELRLAAKRGRSTAETTGAPFGRQGIQRGFQQGTLHDVKPYSRGRGCVQPFRLTEAHFLLLKPPKSSGGAGGTGGTDPPLIKVI